MSQSRVVFLQSAFLNRKRKSQEKFSEIVLYCQVKIVFVSGSFINFRRQVSLTSIQIQSLSLVF